MTALETFLREHEQARADLGRILAGLGDAELRARPAGLNSIAWLLWHMARVEDACLALCIFSTPQVLDERDWSLGVPRRDAGTGMARDEAAAVSARLELTAVHAYHDAVGQRTRALAARIWPDRWTDPLSAADLGRSDEAGIHLPPLAGTPRAVLLTWWGVHHNYWHTGQCAAIRGLLGGRC
jgi:hypothetical protein